MLQVWMVRIEIHLLTSLATWDLGQESTSSRRRLRATCAERILGYSLRGSHPFEHGEHNYDTWDIVWDRFSSEPIWLGRFCGSHAPLHLDFDYRRQYRPWPKQHR